MGCVGSGYIRRGRVNDRMLWSVARGRVYVAADCAPLRSGIFHPLRRRTWQTPSAPLNLARNALIRAGGR